MVKKRILAMVSALAVLCSSVIPGAGAETAEAASGAEGTTYYVSTLHGKDRNDGKSQDTPFYSLQKINKLELKPGDKVLLECGSRFMDGYLHLFGQSGSQEAPIVIDKYGEGAAPIIDTNGQGIWFQNYGYRLDNPNHKFQGYVSSSILLYDTEYIEINNLEIINRAPVIDTAYNAVDVMNRTGVAAVAQDKGTVDHIYLNGLNIHDVMGNVYDKHMNNGGIYFTVFQPHGEKKTTTTLNGAVKADTIEEAASGISRYDDVKIENCTVENTNRWGIAVGYSAYWDVFPDKVKAISDEDIRKYGSTNVVIRNNYVKDSGGDAITLMYCDRPLVEYNVSDGAARQINNTDYSQIKVPNANFGRVAAAIWPWKCKNALFQYNEAFDTRNGDAGNDDAQAWDADSGDGTLYQYNYSHNNTGGCVMFCLADAYQNTFRYNISQNDLKGAMDIAGNPDAHVYNNTFYMKEGVPFIRQRNNGGYMVAENNIIYYSGEEPMADTWRKNGKIGLTFSNNLYYNYASKPVSDEQAIEVAKGTQVLKQPGSGPTYAVKAARLHSDPTVRSAFEGYKLVENSPALGKGKIITDNNGKEPCTVDFFGNEITASETPDIGAHKYQAEAEEVVTPAAPQAPEISEAGETEVTITFPVVWDVVGISGYKIMDGDTVLLDITEPEKMMDEAGKNILVKLTNLEPGKKYSLSVSAYDMNGEMSAPTEINFTPVSKKEPVNPEPPVVNPPEVKPPTEKPPVVSPPAQNPSVKLDRASAVIYTKGSKTVTLRAIVAGVSGSVVWTSSSPKTATVSNGVVTAKKPGKAVITAAVGNYKASCTVTVKKPALKLKKKSVTVKKGRKLKLKVTAVPKGKVTYKSSSKKIASVTKKGVVKGIKKGRCKITIKCNGVKKVIKVKVK